MGYQTASVVFSMMHQAGSSVVGEDSPFFLLLKDDVMGREVAHRSLQAL